MIKLISALLIFILTSNLLAINITEDSLYQALKQKNLNEMTDREYDYFKTVKEIEYKNSNPSIPVVVQNQPSKQDSLLMIKRKKNDSLQAEANRLNQNHFSKRTTLIGITVAGFTALFFFIWIFGGQSSEGGDSD